MTELDTRWKAGAAIALVLAAGGGFAITRLTAPAAPVPPVEEKDEAGDPDAVTMTPQAIRASEIVVAPAAAGAIDAALPASATVAAAPDAEAVLTARAAGTVTRIFKRIGDPVRAGATVALVESRDASAIAADQGAAAARVTLARQQLARERSLLAQGISPRADMETAQAGLGVALAEARRASAAAGAARVVGDGRSVAVSSPISGRIVAAPGNLGAYVQADTELFRVADPARIQIEASLPPADAGRVRAGDRVELTTGDGRSITGRVRAATGVVDPQTRQATVAIDPVGGGLLVPGQIVQARLFASGGILRKGVAVPQEAVQTLAGRDVVFVRTASGFKARAVRIAGRSAGLVELADLPAGTPIVTKNAFLLKAELGKESAE